MIQFHNQLVLGPWFMFCFGAGVKACITIIVLELRELQYYCNYSGTNLGVIRGDTATVGQ